MVKGTTKGPGGDSGVEFFAPEFVGGESGKNCVSYAIPRTNFKSNDGRYRSLRRDRTYSNH